MSQLKNTTINDTGFLQLPVGTSVQRPGTLQAGQIRYNTTLNEPEYYDGSTWRPLSDSNPEATGGTIVDTDIGGVPYRIHMFTNTGNSTFTVTKGGEVEYLIVAGGGGGSNRHQGGGGAGGVLTGITTVITQTYTITVGAGGNGTNQDVLPARQNGTNGQNSSAFGLTAIGGGVSSSTGGSGSGGGAGAVGSAGTTGQGNSGGNGSYVGGGFINESSYNGGGGGGAGSVGGNALTATPGMGGDGGVGITSSITGNIRYYGGGGGGGGATSSISGGSGGTGGGGDGGPTMGLVQKGAPGTSNSGGGGGSGAFGGSTNYASGAGGSGIVVVRYRRNATTATAPTRVEKSTLPLIANNNLENLLVSRSSLLTYVDARQTSSYPGSGTTWTDLSGNGFNGELIDGPFFVNEVKGIIRFDGINDCIHFSNPSNRWAWAPIGTLGNTTLSFEMWTKSTDTNGQYISRPWNGSGQYNYWITHNSWYVTAGSTAASLGFSSLATGRWEHIVTIVTPTAYAVYRNGILDAGFTTHGVTGDVPSAGNGGLPLALMTLYPYGSGWGGNTGFSIQGDVAVFRAYNRVLSADEVLSHYQSERARFGV